MTLFFSVLTVVSTPVRNVSQEVVIAVQMFSAITINVALETAEGFMEGLNMGKMEESFMEGLSTGLDDDFLGNKRKSMKIRHKILLSFLVPVTLVIVGAICSIMVITKINHKSESFSHLQTSAH